KEKLNYNVIKETKVSHKGLLLSFIMIVSCIMINYYENSSLKIVGEFSRNNLIEFIFQNIYYIFEVGLVFLIMTFGQEFFEKLLNKDTNIPYGGILLACTWGLVHT